MEKRAISFRLISAFKNAQDILSDNLQVDRDDFYRWLVKQDYKGRLADLLDLENLDQYASIKQLVEGSIEQKLKKNGKIYWADKAPNLQLFIPDLLLLIPDAKIIHIIRDGRANAFSVARRSYQHLQWSAQDWVDVNIPGLLNRDLLGADRYHFIRYEDLLREPEDSLKALCDFLDLPYSAQMLEFGQGEVAEEKRYVKSSLDIQKIDQYRSLVSKQELQKIERIQRLLLEKFNYPIHSLPPPKYQPLSLGSKIAYHQFSNIKMLFRNQQKGMRDRKNVEIRIPFRNRVYTFFLKLGQDLLSRSIVRSVFRRTFYKKRYFHKSDNNNENV